MKIRGKSKSINYKRQVLGGLRPLSSVSVTTEIQNISSQFEWYGTTSDDTETEIFLNGSADERLIIQDGETSIFTGDGYAYDIDNELYKLFSFSIIIERDGSTTAVKLYENVVKGIPDSSLTTCYIQFRADDTNEALACYVKGLAGTNFSYRVVLNKV